MFRKKIPFLKGGLQSFFILFLLALASGTQAQFYNGYQMTFGKNRVQFEERFWSFYKWKSFDTYFYLGGQELAVYTGRIAENDLEEIEKLLDYKLEGRIQFIIYNKLSDAKQSNIGLQTDETSYNIGGTTKIVGNKVFLYFTGDHDKLHRQIRAGMAKVLIDQMMYGGDIKDRLQNSALLNLPDWYFNGLLSYLASRWNVEIDGRVRDGIISKKYFKINHLTGEDATYVGHSVWKYIIDTYGESSVPNLLYMTRINRNIESGFLYVLGLSLRDLTDNWQDAMVRLYSNSDVGREAPAGKMVIVKPKKDQIYSEVKVSPDGRYVAYVRNDLGKYKVYAYDLERKKPPFLKRSGKKILKGGYRSYVQETDISFPLLAWHPSGQVLALIRERKGKLWLGYYTLSTKKYEESRLFNFEKVIDFSYSPDGQRLLFSAVQKGQSDIFVYDLRTRTYDQITQDYYDDLHPRFIHDGTAIVFSSNRLDDTLRVTPSLTREVITASPTLDIFYYDYATHSKVLHRITNTPLYNETNPMPYDSSSFAYLSDENGIVNRYAAYLDSTLLSVDTVMHYAMIVTTYPQTNYSKNILEQSVNSRLNRVAELFYYNGRYRMYVEPLKPVNTETSSIPNTLYRNETLKYVEATGIHEQPAKPTQQEITTPVDSNYIDIDNYIFQSDLPKSKKKEKKKEGAAPTATPPSSDTTSVSTLEANLPKQRNYDPAFSSNYFVSQLDNGLLNQSYQAFTGGGVYFNPSLNAFFKIGISDLLDDYRITGGFKLSFDFNSNEYYMSYENLKHRLDHQITFYRQARFENFGYLTKIHSHEVRYYAKYPFSDITSLRGSAAYRNDRGVFLSTDLFSLREPNYHINTGTGKLEFVFDNTLPTGLNLFNGTRAKVFAEYFHSFDAPYIDVTTGEQFKKATNMYVVGLDIRHYQKLHREIIWANRFAASTSWGDEKLIYYMGATDGWITPHFNTETPIDYSQNYAYQAVATNLRGFDQNIRNGNSFVLVNSELRIPLFKYLLNRPIRSDLLRNFQIVGFGDVGTAWNGASPYDSTNALNNKVFTSGFTTVTVISQHDPIVGGYGFGLRSRVLGYFLRADWAWGMEDREQKPRKFYLSLSLDF